MLRGDPRQPALNRVGSLVTTGSALSAAAILPIILTLDRAPHPMNTTTVSPTVRLQEPEVRALFANAKTQADYIHGLYRMVHPDADTIRQLNASPICSKDTWLAICELAKTVDERINRDRGPMNQIMLGGAWLNYGFTTQGGDDLPLWHVVPVAENDIVR